MTLVDPGWVAERLGEPDLAVVDLRWREDGSGRARYERSRIPGAVHVEWTSDIVEPDAPYAFTLASAERFARAMEARGIGDDSTVVAYADRHGSGPFRLWWAFRLYGHDGQVRILDGGWRAWVEAGLPVEEGPPPPPRAGAGWTPREALATVATADDVDRAPREGVAVLDARPPEQHAGEAVWFETGAVPADAHGIAHTPRGDLRAGRVPGSVNVPWFDLYDPRGRMRSAEELRARFAEAGVRPGDRAITYCGVALSASALAYALDRAGIEARVYEHSWDEWGRSERPIERD